MTPIVRPRFHKKPSGGKKRWLTAKLWLEKLPPSSERDFLIAVAVGKIGRITMAPKFPAVKGFKQISENLKSECEALCKAIVFNRERGPDGIYTCITHPTEYRAPKLQWGHFIEQHKSAWLQYDPRNCSTQCGQCNGEYKGRQREFGEALDLRHGSGFADGLRQEKQDMQSWKPTTANLEKVKQRLIAECRGLRIPIPEGVTV